MSPAFTFRSPVSAFRSLSMLDVGCWMLDVGCSSSSSMSDLSLLSTKSIAPSDRLIFALDVPTKADALEWIDQLEDSVTFYKIGLELFCSGAYFELLETLHLRGKKVFADL